MKARDVSIISVNAACPRCRSTLSDNDGNQRILPKPAKKLTCTNCGEVGITLPKWVDCYSGRGNYDSPSITLPMVRRVANGRKQKAVAYYRTSSAANNGSFERQRAATEGYAGTNGLLVVDEYYDTAVKGNVPISTRPGFTMLLADCKANGVRTIIFESVGRFANDPIVQELGYQDLKKAGFTLIAVEAPYAFLKDDPTTTFMRQVLCAVAQYLESR